MGILTVLLLLRAENAVADIVIFMDGSRLSVQSYRLEGELLVMTMMDGELRSVLRGSVDLEATERLNGAGQPQSALPPVADVPPPATPPADENGGTAFNLPALSHEPATTAPSEAAAPTSTGSLPAFSPPAPRAPEVMARDSASRSARRTHVRSVSRVQSIFDAIDEIADH